MTSVDSLAGVVEVLRGQGALIGREEDLRPSLLGRNGNVGFVVPFPDGRSERVWVRVVSPSLYRGSSLATSKATATAEVAEWLTLELVEAGGVLEVPVVIDRYLALPVVGAAQRPEERTEALMLLASLVHSMGFIADPLAQTIRLPEDHPLA